MDQTARPDMVAMTPLQMHVSAVYLAELANCLPGAFAYASAMTADGLILEIHWHPSPDSPKKIDLQCALWRLEELFRQWAEDEEPMSGVTALAQQGANYAWRIAHQHSLVDCLDRPQDEDGWFVDDDEQGTHF